MDQFISEVLNNGQINPVLIAPVLFVVIGAILVFVFGFKKPVEPHFKKLASVDSAKRAKRKEKSQKLTQNGNLVTSQEKISDGKKREAGQQQDKSQQKGVVVQAKKDKLVAKKDVSSPKRTEEKKSVTSPTKKQTPKKEKLQPKEKNTESAAAAAASAEGGVGGVWVTVTKDRKKKVEELPVPETQTKKSENPEKLSPGRSGPADKGKKKDTQKPSKEKQSIKEATAEKSPPAVSGEVKTPEDMVVVAAPQPIKLDTASELIEPVGPIEPVVERPKIEESAIDDKDSSDASQDIKIDVRFTSGNNVVFDELGDAWTEAKAPRKSKKKARKE